ncbi:hypothetical protein HID58_084624, partial [Brassica napus]
HSYLSLSYWTIHFMCLSFVEVLIPKSLPQRLRLLHLRRFRSRFSSANNGKPHGPISGEHKRHEPTENLVENMRRSSTKPRRGGAKTKSRLHVT